MEIQFLFIFFLFPILILSILRQRNLREINQPLQVLYSNLQQIEEENEHIIETIPLRHFNHLQEHVKGGFIIFLLLLVIFFLFLSLVVSNNFFLDLELKKSIENNLNYSYDNSYDNNNLNILNLKCNIPSGSNLIGAYQFTNNSENINFSRNDNYNSDFKITTNSKVTQLLFIQGILHLYSFNQVESMRNFQASLEYDKNCAICYWGIAAASSSNLNYVRTNKDYKIGYEAIQTSKLLLLKNKQFHKSNKNSINNENCYNKEELLINAMIYRFPLTPSNWINSSTEIHQDIEKNYSLQLEKVYKKCNNDADIISLYSESILNLSPWNYFQSKEKNYLNDNINDEYPSYLDLHENSMKAFNILHNLLFNSNLNSKLNNRILSNHPLALHLYIHVTEQFYSPQNTKNYLPITAANILFNQSMLSSHHLIGHLLHMPSHIYYRNGMFNKCIRSSKKAVEVDQLYETKCFNSYFPSHNLALLVMCSMANGDLNTSITYTLHEKSISLSTLESTKFMTSMVPWSKDIIYTRFGKWFLVNSLQEKSLKELNLSNISYFGLSLHLYTKCLSKISLSYYNTNNLLLILNKSLKQKVQTQEQLQEQKQEHEYCLIELNKTTQLIPLDNKLKSHYFYQYHQEIGIILVNLVSTSLSLSITRSNIILLLSSLISTTFDDNNKDNQLSSISISRFYDLCFIILKSYQESLLSLLSIVRLEDSFNYMEPETFYFPLNDCYFPLLQEIQIFLIFINDYMTILINKEKEITSNDVLNKFTSIYNWLNNFINNINLDKLYKKEKLRRYSQNESIWYKKGKERYEMIKERQLKYETNKSKLIESNIIERMKLLVDWFMNEQNQYNYNKQSDNSILFELTHEIYGSCCELQFC